jgi:hypothetical protein
MTTARAPGGASDRLMYAVTGACECGQPSTVTYRTSRGAPFDEACADCDQWITKTFVFQSRLLDCEIRHLRGDCAAAIADVLDALEGIPLQVARLYLWIAQRLAK